MHRLSSFFWCLSLLTQAWPGPVGAGESVIADENPAAHWQVACEHGADAFSLDLRSASGDVTEDDMRVLFTGTRGLTVRLALKPALYVARGAITPVLDLCGGKGVVAFAVGGKRALLWVSKDNRPSFDLLDLALVDLVSGRLLDYRLTGLAIKAVNENTRLTINPDRGGWNVRAVTEGLPYSDSAESAIESWVSVRVKGNSIVINRR